MYPLRQEHESLQKSFDDVFEPKVEKKITDLCRIERA